MKGLAAAGIGLLLGSMGAAPRRASALAFGLVYLNDRTALVVMALGISRCRKFLISWNTRSHLPDAATRQRPRPGIVNVFANWWLVLRVSVIGGIIGILPGVAARPLTGWPTAMLCKPRRRSRFGKGDIRV